VLTKEILDALRSYAGGMHKSITFVVQTGIHNKREELLDFLTQIASVSDKLSVVEREASLRSPMSFALEADGEPTGIEFSGIPGGHEFNSLILAMLQSSGTPAKLDSSVQTLVGNINEKLRFEVFISLSCHNCPDVVQTLNQFALLNDKISSEMIDGGLFQNTLEELDIQGVPCVYLNGELFANGKVDPAQLVDKLIGKYPDAVKTEASSDAHPEQDVTVVGGGPAGVSAAIYSARKGLKVTLIADWVGGQVKDTIGIENLISVTKTTGPELVSALQAHMNDYEITLKHHIRVSEIADLGKRKEVRLSTGEKILTKTVIIATGARWRELGIPGEKEYTGNGVAYCPHCDGPFFKGKDVAVIGGGNSGVEAALDLAGIVKSVNLYEFMPELKADQVLINKAESTANISIYKNVAVKEVLATNGKVSGLAFEDRATSKLQKAELSGVFVQIGLVPNSQFVKGLVETTSSGEIRVNEKCQTSVPGIYACGDVTTVPYKQIVIAMGEGSKASLSAFEYLLTLSDDRIDQQAAALVAFTTAAQTVFARRSGALQTASALYL